MTTQRHHDQQGSRRSSRGVGSGTGSRSGAMDLLTTPGARRGGSSSIGGTASVVRSPMMSAGGGASSTSFIYRDPLPSTSRGGRGSSSTAASGAVGGPRFSLGGLLEANTPGGEDYAGGGTGDVSTLGDTDRDREGEPPNWDVEETRAALRKASLVLMQRGLRVAANWASEQLNGLPPPDQDIKLSHASASAHDDLLLQENTNNPTTNHDRILYAQSLFNMGEYDRAVHSLSSTDIDSAKQPQPSIIQPSHYDADDIVIVAPPPIHDLSPYGVFLRAYALYLSGERRKEEEIVELRDPLERARVTNPNLVQLAEELSTLYHRNQLDAFGLYIYGVVLKKLRQQRQQPQPQSSIMDKHQVSITAPPTPSVEHVLVQSILRFPYNWSAMLDLADAFVKYPAAVQEDIEQALRPLSNHFMYHCFLIHVFLERQQNEEALHYIDGLTYRRVHVPSTDAPPEENQPSAKTPRTTTTSPTIQTVGLFTNSNFLRATTAVAYYNMRDFDTAQEHFLELLRYDPLRIDHMDIYSNILYVKQSKAELSNLAHSAMKNDKYRPETCCIVGNYYSLRAQHEKAVQYFQRALKIDRTYLSAWTLMGHEYVEMKNTAAAIEAYRRAVDINPRDFRAWYGLGQTYEILNMPLYALFYYRKAAALRPYDARMWCAMGGCYQNLDKRVDAIRSYERAVANHDREGIATKKLAALYREEGNVEKAAKCYHRYLDLRSTAAGLLLGASPADAGAARAGAAAADLDAEGGQVDATEAEALLYLAFYYKNNKSYEVASRLCSRLLEYPGPEKEEAKALLREIRSRVDNERTTTNRKASDVGAGLGSSLEGGDSSFAFSP